MKKYFISISKVKLNNGALQYNPVKNTNIKKFNTNNKSNYNYEKHKHTSCFNLVSSSCQCPVMTCSD